MEVNRPKSRNPCKINTLKGERSTLFFKSRKKSRNSQTIHEEGFKGHVKLIFLSYFTESMSNSETLVNICFFLFQSLRPSLTGNHFLTLITGRMPYASFTYCPALTRPEETVALAKGPCCGKAERCHQEPFPNALLKSILSNFR